MGTIVGADITQGVGVTPFSVEASGVDFVVSTSLKWLCGTSGAGILYVKPGLLASCQPELRGWFSQENPFSWALDKFAFATDARRFDHGTPAILASVASLPGIDWVNATGIDAIQAHNRALCRRIIAEADARGWALASPADENERGGSVMLTLPEGTDGQAIVAGLRAQKLYCDARGRTLRLSPGVVTNMEAVEALCAALGHMIATATAA
jgi:selenocysteine lyase/cysteine desulfurase